MDFGGQLRGVIGRQGRLHWDQPWACMASATLFILITPKFLYLAQTSLPKSSGVWICLFISTKCPTGPSPELLSLTPFQICSYVLYISGWYHYPSSPQTKNLGILFVFSFSVLTHLLQFLLIYSLIITSVCLPSPHSFPLRPSLYYLLSVLHKHSHNWLPCIESYSPPSSICHIGKTQKHCSNTHISSSHSMASHGHQDKVQNPCLAYKGPAQMWPLPTFLALCYVSFPFCLSTSAMLYFSLSQNIPGSLISGPFSGSFSMSEVPFHFPPQLAKSSCFFRSGSQCHWLRTIFSDALDF